MTNTVPIQFPANPPIRSGPTLKNALNETLVDKCVQWTIARIEGQVFKPGARLPSIRAMAKSLRVSPFTVVQAYDRLVAMGVLKARVGSGFYVQGPRRAPRPAIVHSQIDLVWLTRHMIDSAGARGPGLGVLPAAWLNGSQIGAAVRGLGRESTSRWLASGSSHGFEPLREVLQHRLAGLGIVARADQIVLTSGITHGLDLVLRALIEPGDSVLALNPCWFGALGMLAVRGARIVGVPCNRDGPDLDAMANLAAETRPKLMILSSTAHNPTGQTLDAPSITRILEIAARHDIAIFEDDVYADLGVPNAVRLAAVDRLDRVVYAGSFSKTLASNLRVGFIAARGDRAQAIANAKLLSGFTTPELNERLLHKLLIEGRYAKHVAALRARLAESRQTAFALLAREGIPVFGRPESGLFFWVDMGCDTNELAIAANKQNYLVAPGSLFSPSQERTSWMRFNVTTRHDTALAELLRTAKASSAHAGSFKSR
jgi:DNA-binding transcriptional MocR family regulator